MCHGATVVQLLHVNITPSPTSLRSASFFSTVNNLHVNIAPPPTFPCHIYNIFFDNIYAKNLINN